MRKPFKNGLVVAIFIPALILTIFHFVLNSRSLGGVSPQPLFLLGIGMVAAAFRPVDAAVIAICSIASYLVYLVGLSGLEDYFHFLNIVKICIFSLTAIITAIGVGYLKFKLEQRLSEAEARALRIEEIQLRKRLRYENLLLEITKRLLNKTEISPLSEIELSIKEIGETLGLDKFGIFINRPNGDVTDMIYQWNREGTANDLAQFQDIRASSFPYSLQILNSYGIFKIDRLEDLPSEAEADRNAMIQRGVKSCLVISLQFQGPPRGYICADYVTETPWSREMVTTLQILAEVFANALSRSESEEKLIQHSKALERSNRNLERFAYVCSHDLQEPLRTISIFLELLRRRESDVLSSESKSIMEQVVEASRRMSAMIRDILTYSRAIDGKTDLTAVSIDELLKEALSNLKVAIAESRAQISCEGKFPTLSVDRRQVLQVFQNLISNSIKYRGSNVPSIRISSEDEGSVHRFRISDNGIGIDPRFHNKIFQIFQRLHVPDKTGTGIGLALVKGIIESHGGRIWVESDLGSGADFIFELPKLALRRRA